MYIYIYRYIHIYIHIPKGTIGLGPWYSELKHRLSRNNYGCDGRAREGKKTKKKKKKKTAEEVVVSQNLLGVPVWDQEYSIVGSILGSLYFGKLPSALLAKQVTTCSKSAAP